MRKGEGALGHELVRLSMSFLVHMEMKFGGAII
jgi:hypothetical protein